jgi:hypothetical protein
MLVANHELNSVKPRVLVGALTQCDTPVELRVTEEFWTNSVTAGSTATGDQNAYCTGIPPANTCSARSTFCLPD